VLEFDRHQGETGMTSTTMGAVAPSTKNMGAIALAGTFGTII
jgi:hypothetical protein